jgi:uncharacterized membrane protein YeaQ/YmgE (transglycosylase-associated protein family)
MATHNETLVRAWVLHGPLRKSQQEKSVLHYLWMFVVGLVVGLIARFIMPGSEQLGLLMTGILGILGSFVGGAIARVFSKPADGALVPSGWADVVGGGGADSSFRLELLALIP